MIPPSVSSPESSVLSPQDSLAKKKKFIKL